MSDLANSPSSFYETSGGMIYLRRFRVSSSNTTPRESPKKSSGSVAGPSAGDNLSASAIFVGVDNHRNSRPPNSLVTGFFLSLDAGAYAGPRCLCSQPYARAEHALRLCISIARSEARCCLAEVRSTLLFLEWCATALSCPDSIRWEDARDIHKCSVIYLRPCVGVLNEAL